MNIFFQNALITGGSGMVGKNMAFGIKPTSEEMDITSRLSIESYMEKLDVNPSCIIHLASCNLRESEEDMSKAVQINIDGTIHMLEVAKKYNISFVLVSSGAVFSSQDPNRVFYEKTQPCPNSAYGKTKNTAEKVALLYEKSIIIRTGWLFGGNQKLHYKFVENCIQRLVLNQEVKASNNFNGSPTYVMDVIHRLKEIVFQQDYGIHHVVNDGYATGYDIGFEIGSILQKDTSLIIPMQSHLIPNSGPKRSSAEVLGTTNEFNKMRHWKEALREYVEKYTNTSGQSAKKWFNRETCRLCNSYEIEVFFSLEPSVPANHFVKNKTLQEKIPLDVAICRMCHHIQLIQVVEPSFQYLNYLYVSSTSSVMVEHLQKNAMRFIQENGIEIDDRILEIGANDGVCIKHLLNNGYKNIVGIDPSVNINCRHQLPIVCDFFGSTILNSFREKYGHFKLIFAFHCCAHIENIQDVFKTVYELLDNDGVFVMEVGYFYEVFKKKMFDTIYHEHIDYHTCTAMTRFVEQNDMVLFDVKTNDIQNGSIQFYISKDKAKKVQNTVYEMMEKENQTGIFDLVQLVKWKKQVLLNGRDIECILNSFVDNGKIVVGYGASAKSTTFLHQYKLTNRHIQFIIDDNVYKHYYFSPGLHIPIRPMEYLQTERVDYIIILSWNFTKEIVEKLQPFIENGTRIIVPFPTISIF